MLIERTNNAPQAGGRPRPNPSISGRTYDLESSWSTGHTLGFLLGLVLLAATAWFALSTKANAPTETQAPPALTIQHFELWRVAEGLDCDRPTISEKPNILATSYCTRFVGGAPGTGSTPKKEQGFLTLYTNGTASFSRFDNNRPDGAVTAVVVTPTPVASPVPLDARRRGIG